MDTNLINKLEQTYSKTAAVKFQVGDTVEVSNVIREGDKQRIQKFKGLVMSIKGSGLQKMFTVRKISYGVGVEKIFPVYSPNVASITVIKTGNVRRSKLYYMRKRVGRSALKVRAGEPMVVVEHADSATEAAPEDIVTAAEVEAVMSPEAETSVEAVDTQTEQAA